MAMKAIVYDRYGPPEVLQLRDVEVPDVGEDGVLVRVHAAALNPADWHFMTGLRYFLRLGGLALLRPKVRGLGSDVAGRVEAVGRRVTRFRPGDEVYGQVDEAPGMSVPDLGSVAEFVQVSVGSIRARPCTLDAVEAAAVPLAASTALRGLCDVGNVQPGQHVLINGASGRVGTFAVQIAKASGAEVTAVCSTRNVDLVRSLGADHVVDYTRDDFTRGNRPVDLLLDNVGNHSPTASRRILAPTATYLASFDHPGKRLLGPLGQALRAAALGVVVGQRLTILATTRRDDDLDRLTALVEAGQVRPVVDRTWPLVETRAAMEHLAGRHARGKVVITVGEGS